MSLFTPFSTIIQKTVKNMQRDLKILIYYKKIICFLLTDKQLQIYTSIKNFKRFFIDNKKIMDSSITHRTSGIFFLAKIYKWLKLSLNIVKGNFF